MQGSQDATDEDQPFVDTQGSQVAGETLNMVEDSLDNFAGACPEHGPMMEPGEGGTAGADLAAKEVINL